MTQRQEKIIIKIVSSEIEKIEAIMQKMALIPSLEMTPLTYGQLGSDIIASFDIDDGHFVMMVEKLYSSNLNVLPTNDKVTQVLEFLYGKYGKKSFVKTPPPSTASSSNPTPEAIEEFKNTGKYEELFKIVKLVNADPKLKTDAKNAMMDAVKKSIDQNYNSAFVNKHTVPTSIANLLKICGDVNLKTMNLQSMQKQAGVAAITICENYTGQLDELIKISNNSLLPNAVNLKAAAKFWQIISKDIEKRPGDAASAVKTTNLRFLENAFDIAKDELSEAEKNYFNDFAAFIRLKKST
jgi:hypothetical protein